MEKDKKKVMSANDMRKIYAQVMIVFPSILLVICSMTINSFLARAMAQAVLFVLQILVVKGIVDEAYKY
jgi:peroxiredoxin